MFDAEPNISEYNTAFAIIYRLDTLHKYLHRAHVNRDHWSIYKLLNCIFKELYRMLNSDKKLLGQHLELRKKVQESFFNIENLKKTKKDIPAYLYDSFDDWELELNSFEQKCGMGIKKGADARFAMGGR